MISLDFVIHSIVYRSLFLSYLGKIRIVINILGRVLLMCRSSIKYSGDDDVLFILLQGTWPLILAAQWA